MRAFPFQHKNPTSGLTTESAGMELRDYFAAKAMQALIWNPDVDLENREDVAEVAYGYADAMLKAREVKHDNN